MKVYIILGNTRKNSNTEALTRLFADEMIARNVDVVITSLREMSIQSCIGCDGCHSVFDSFGCNISDDMHKIADTAFTSDLIIFASPIYTWMPTPPLKAVMDRFYAFTKYPQGSVAFNLLKKQKIAMIATSGDDCTKNCDLFDEAVRRMSNFANLSYIGYLAALDNDVRNGITEAVKDDVIKFADKCNNMSDTQEHF